MVRKEKALAYTRPLKGRKTWKRWKEADDPAIVEYATAKYTAKRGKAEVKWIIRPSKYKKR